ncbi:g8242 [Coccomyxa elongata]
MPGYARGGGGEFRGGGRGGDFRGGGRRGGRGRGFGNFDDRPPPSFGPDREAPLGSAARPGKQISLLTSGESTVTVERAYAGFPPALQAFHYDVAIAPVRRIPPETETTSKSTQKDKAPRAPAKPLTPELARRVIEALAEMEDWPKAWAFDGRKNIYTARLFSGLPQTETVYEALDVALKHSVSYFDDVKMFARAIFWRDPSKVWLGYQQSLRPSHAGLTLNVDMAATAFLEPQMVIDFLQKAVGLRSPQDFAHLNPMQHRKATKAITGLRIEVRLGGAFKRKYKVKGLMGKGAGELVFHNEQEAKDMTVADYYAERYNVRLKYPEVPCINVGTPTKPVWLPPEICWIVEGQRRLKLDERQTAEMIKTAAQRPQERKDYIQKCIKDFARLPNDPVVEAFKLTLDPDLLKVEGRQLPPPELQYSRNRQPFKVVPQPDRGSWDMRDVKFYRPGEIKSFAISVFCNQRGAEGPVEDPASLQNFMRDLLRGCSKAGIAMPNASPVPESIIAWHNPHANFPGDTVAAAHDAAVEYFGQAPDIIFVILPERGQTDVYKAVKRASDSHLGVPSQCFNLNKAGICTPPRRGREQYVGNVAMKINAKIKGINAILIGKPVKWMEEPFMVLGADVTHPVGFNPNSPSVAAVVGSLDRYLSCFGAQILLQGHRVELLLNLKDALKNLLILFHKANGVKPKRIIMFRDGVSEGRYPQVQRHEIPQVAEAICELDQTEPGDCRIPVTYIVASKGHRTRLFPATPKDGDKNGNVFPGTVVDQGIVHPIEYDFYLNSHASIQGTSRPAHYHVLLDQNGLGPDALQNFTYNMSYLFCRCTRSVSVVPPCYYAHLAAFRGRILVNESLSDTESSVSSASAGALNVEFAQTHQNLLNRMFYV